MAKEEKDELTEYVEKDTAQDDAIRVLVGIVPYIVILVVVVLVRTFIITPVIVSGESMKPTYDGGEVLLLYKLAKYKDYDRFDIVVVQKDDERIIKRVIALPGETISCEKGIIYVNDRKLEDDYGTGLNGDFEKVKLGDNEYFVLGDNRNNSTDSRFEQVGNIDGDDIVGKAWVRVYPFNEFGLVDNIE